MLGNCDLLKLCSRALLKNLIGPQLVQKFPAFYGTRKFITTFITVYHLSVYLAKKNPSLSLPISLLKDPILIVSSHKNLGLPSGSFHMSHNRNPVSTYPVSHTFYTPRPLIDLRNRIIFAER
jgi:hypothetical protein